MKPNTYTQLYTHVVFAVKYRECLIKKEYREKIFSYMSGIITNLENKSIIVNGVSDHVHILFGLNPDNSISEIVKEVKRCSTKYINENNWIRGKFNWQEGYGAFSYSRSHLDKIYKYIANQEKHHAKKNFKAEYLNMLRKFDIEFKDEYLFEFFDDVDC